MIIYEMRVKTFGDCFKIFVVTNAYLPVEIKQNKRHIFSVIDTNFQFFSTIDFFLLMSLLQ